MNSCLFGFGLWQGTNQTKKRSVMSLEFEKYIFSYACPPFFLSAVIMAGWRAWPYSHSLLIHISILPLECIELPHLEYYLYFSKVVFFFLIYEIKYTLFLVSF